MTSTRKASRVVVDGTQHPIHDDAPSLRFTVTSEDGMGAEVQIAHVGDGLNVVIAGAPGELRRDHRGFYTLWIAPTQSAFRP